MKVFHFTDFEGYQSIKRQGWIHPSDGSARYGPYVYLTDLDPNNFHQSHIAKSLFQGGSDRRLKQGRLDFHFQIDVPVHELSKERENVYRYIGISGSLELSRYDIVSQGDENAFLQIGAAMAAGVTLAIIGYGLHSSSASGERSRTQDLAQRLDRLLIQHSQASSFKTEQSPDGSQVLLLCRSCAVNNKKKCQIASFRGGTWYADSIEAPELKTKMTKHLLEEHFIEEAVLPLSVFVGAVSLVIYWHSDLFIIVFVCCFVWLLCFFHS